MTPTEASLRGRLAAHTRWAREPDRPAATLPARRGLEARFEREVDGEFAKRGVRPTPENRAKAIENQRHAYYTAMALERHRRIR